MSENLLYRSIYISCLQTLSSHSINKFFPQGYNILWSFFILILHELTIALSTVVQLPLMETTKAGFKMAHTAHVSRASLAAPFIPLLVTSLCTYSMWGQSGAQSLDLCSSPPTKPTHLLTSITCMALNMIYMPMYHICI